MKANSKLPPTLTPVNSQIFQLSTVLKKFISVIRLSKNNKIILVLINNIMIKSAQLRVSP